jgi:hypothetical protein
MTGPERDSVDLAAGGTRGAEADLTLAPRSSLTACEVRNAAEQRERGVRGRRLEVDRRR